MDLGIARENCGGCLPLRALNRRLWAAGTAAYRRRDGIGVVPLALIGV